MTLLGDISLLIGFLELRGIVAWSVGFILLGQTAGQRENSQLLQKLRRNEMDDLLLRCAPMRHLFVAIALLSSHLCFADEAVPTRRESAATTTETKKRLIQLQAKQRHLLEIVRAQLSELPIPPDPTPDDSEATKATRVRWLQLKSRLEAIEGRIRIENSPRTAFISGMPKPGVLRDYYVRLKKRIEDAALEDFPKEDGQSIHGKVRVDFILDSKGSVLDVSVISTTSEHLSTYSKQLLQRLSPFEPFAPEVSERVDHIIITNSFDFHRIE